MTLSADQRRFFDRQGYLVVENALSARILADLRGEYAALLDGLYADWATAGLIPPDEGLDFWAKLGAAYAAGCDWFQPMDCSLPGGQIAADTPFHFGPAAFAMITYEPLLDIVEALIGPEITSNPIQHIRIKPPQEQVHAGETRAHVSVTDWHQDRGVTLAEADATTMITVWLAITDVTQASAPLQVIPGHHRGALIEHCGWAQTGIPKTLVPTERAVSVPCAARSAVIFHPLTPHASLPNRSDRYRWSFDIRYNKSGQPTGRAHFPSFVARSRAAPDTVLRDWRIWRKSWETARARLAGAPHVPIHRWDTSSPICA
ncbi:MAG: phytanoyl-CoA dioxygenase family protein [Pseudomonadota bacterium]